MKHTFLGFMVIMILMSVGLALVIVHSDLMVGLGLYLWTWGNNIDMQGKF